MATPSNTLTAFAAALAFALVACQPDTGRIADAHAADVEAEAADDDGLLAEAEQDDANPPDDADPQDGEDEDAGTSAVASAEGEAAATEQATAATDDALIDTREGGNPLADAPVDLEPVEDDEE